MLPLESLHPGGLSLTRELSVLCAIGAGSRVVDVACGTGETACFLAESLGARVIGLDHSTPPCWSGHGARQARAVST